MRLLLTFIIFILGVFYTFGDNNCCEQCCEYLENCCKKGEGNKKEGEEVEVQEEFYLKKSEATDPEEIKKLVSPKWYSNKGEEASFILYEKINGEENQNINDNNGIKVTKYKNGFSIDKNFIPEKDNPKIVYQDETENKLNSREKKYALFEIKTNTNKTVYLYCSDVESSGDYKGIFTNMGHISISVITCDTENVTNMAYMFYGCNSLKKLNIKKFDTSNITDMNSMFYECRSLKKLELKNFDTKNVTNMRGMFFGCSKLKEINFGQNFNSIKVTDMESMFNLCSSLTKLDLEKFNTKNVTNMGHMFFKCYNLTKLDLKNFDTSKVTNMESMFSLCSSLTKLDLKNFDTSKVTNMESMFSLCSSLTELDLKNFDTTKVTNMKYMFFYCSSLENLEYGNNFNTTNVTNKEDMFSWCNNLFDNIKDNFPNKNK